MHFNGTSIQNIISKNIEFNQKNGDFENAKLRTNNSMQLKFIQTNSYRLVKM